MPFGNEADDFMKAFTGVMSLYSKFPTKEEKRLQQLQAQELEQKIGLEPGESAARVHQAEAAAGASEASTAESGARTKFEYGPDAYKQRADKSAADIDQSKAAADESRARTGLYGAQTENVQKEGKWIDDKALADIAQANANAAQQNASAQNLGEEARAKAGENAYKNTTTYLPMFIQSYKQGNEPPEITAEHEKFLGLKPGFFDKNYGAGSAGQDESLFKKFAPGTPDEAVPGPQSSRGAIPTMDGQTSSVEMASYTPDDLVNTHDDDEGHDGGPVGSAPVESAAIPDEPTTSQGPGAPGRIIQAQAGTRRQPISDKLYGTLQQAAADTGLTVRVTSGGQPSSGPNRTGSHRHDHGNAADLQLIDENGKVLSMKDPTDRARMADFIMLSKKYGATGIGAAENYMGDKTLHIGFGTPAVWGAGGHGKNTPSWVREAYYGEGGGAADSPAGQAAASQASRRAPPKLVDAGTSQAYDGWKGVIKAGVRIGAVDTVEDGQAAKQVLTGQGGLDPKVFNAAADTYQKNIPAGYQQSLAERNLGMMAVLSQSALTPEEKTRYAGQLTQTFRQKASQYSAIAKVLAQNGRMDEATQMLVKAYAFIPNGYEANVVKSDNGYQLKIWDLKDPNRVLTEQLLTPQQMFAAIMKTSPADYDRGMAQLAHQGGQPSQEYLDTSANIQGATAPMPRQGPTANPYRAAGQPRSAIPMPNYAAMEPDEADKSRLQITQGQGRIDEMNKATAQPAPFSPDDRAGAEQNIASVLPQMPQTTIDTLNSAYGRDLAGIAANMRQLNPKMVDQDILSTLATMVTPVPNRSGDYDLGYRLNPRTDQTMQGAVSIDTADGRTVNMAVDDAVKMQQAAQRNWRSGRETGRDAATKKAEAAQKATALEERAAPLRDISAQIEAVQRQRDMYRNMLQTDPARAQRELPKLEARLRFLQGRLNERAGIRQPSAIPTSPAYSEEDARMH